MTELDGPRVGPAQGGEPEALVVLLHGLGADGNDLIGLAPVWAPVLPTVAFVSPNAPEPCDMAPFGRQWFSLQNRDPHSMLAGVRSAAPILNAFLDAEMAAAGVSADRVALVGFSQGTMTGLYTALRRSAPVAGILGYSGRLIGDPDGDGVSARPPVTLIHGTNDEIVPFAAMAEAEAGLKADDVAVDSFARPGLGHGIDEIGLGIGMAFLRRVLGL